MLLGKELRPRKECLPGNFLAVQWLRLHASTAVAQVRTLVEELRSHMPRWAVKNKCSFQKPKDPGKRGLLSDQSYKLPGADWESKLELRNDPFWENTAGCM